MQAASGRVYACQKKMTNDSILCQGCLHCNLANLVIVSLHHLTRTNDMQHMMPPAYQVPSWHHPKAAELRWTSLLLSLQTTKFHTGSMITLNHN
jgi:hypothetical protein